MSSAAGADAAGGEPGFSQVGSAYVWLPGQTSPTWEAAVRRVNATAVRRGVHAARVAFLALDPKGQHGAACTAQTNFEYAVGRDDKVELLKAKEIGVEDK